MHRLLLSLLPLLAACTPSPRKAAMTNPGEISATPASNIAESGAEPDEAGNRVAAGRIADGDGRVAQASIPTPIPVEGRAAPRASADSPAAALGRRTLSTAFVRIGPDGYLTIELRDGRLLILRDVRMNAENYCGTRMIEGGASRKYCGDYSDVAAARPGAASFSGTSPDIGAPAPDRIL